MDSDPVLEAAQRLAQDARTWCYSLGNHAGGVSVDELRNAVSLIRDLADVVAQLAAFVRPLTGTSAEYVEQVNRFTAAQKYQPE